MKMENIYEKVCRVLAAGGFCRNTETRFEDICEEAGVGRVTMDNLLYERFGMSGCDMLRAFRKRSL
jgi:hypothetical protein